MAEAPDPRRRSPAVARNREPILAVLRRWLAPVGSALEIAAGGGEHAACFAAALPGWAWQPTDPDPAALASIAAWRESAAAPGLLPPLQLDVCGWPWPLDDRPAFDAIFCANMLHIAPWPACAGLMRGAARHLAASGQLIVYGPFIVDDVATAPSNLEFDADLRARNPAWGLRRLAEVQATAETAGLRLVERAAMPANNLMLRFGLAS